ncbi:prepilin-type N-terminal cleavage/methylation domain-containing protein [Candidatus Parcubacteria bacterium]|nr:prepilin-type N-terminal cleavage/methylation domain-containing protein [Candidatus Parcubacteria bacterium]
MKQKGFALISLLIALAIILIIVFGRGYFDNTPLKDYKTDKERGEEAIKKAEMLKQKIECKEKCLYINEKQWQYIGGSHFETKEQCIDYCLSDK